MRFTLSLLVSALFSIRIVAAQDIDLDSIICLIDQDSLTANVAALQSFDKEICNDYDARSWIFEKMGAANLDSSYIDYFHLGIWGCNFDYRYKGNVIGVKRGSTHPHHLIVISAKYDSNPGSPGADDNCSGAAAVLEIARILRQVDTRMTVVTALFDGGTWAHLGAWNYATRIKRQSDSIVLALNLDQIGGGADSVKARLGFRGDRRYADMMAAIADSLPSLNLDVIPDSSSGDAATYPFEFNGFRALRVSEYEPSPVAGSPNDSLQYLNLNYLTRMTRAALATACAVDNTYDYTPGLYVSFPQGVPLIAFPDRTRSFPVHVEAYGGAIITPGSCRLCAAATGQHVTCSPMEDLGNGDYLASLPAFALRSRIRFHVAAGEQSLGTLVFNNEGESFRA